MDRAKSWPWSELISRYQLPPLPIIFQKREIILTDYEEVVLSRFPWPWTLHRETAGLLACNAAQQLEASAVGMCLSDRRYSAFCRHTSQKRHKNITLHLEGRKISSGIPKTRRVISYSLPRRFKIKLLIYKLIFKQTSNYIFTRIVRKDKRALVLLSFFLFLFVPTSGWKL